MPLNPKQQKVLKWGSVGVIAAAGAVGVYELVKKSAGTSVPPGGTPQTSLQITSVTLSAQ